MGSINPNSRHELKKARRRILKMIRQIGKPVFTQADFVARDRKFAMTQAFQDAWSKMLSSRELKAVAGGVEYVPDVDRSNAGLERFSRDEIYQGGSAPASPQADQAEPKTAHPAAAAPAVESALIEATTSEKTTGGGAPLSNARTSRDARLASMYIRSEGREIAKDDWSSFTGLPHNSAYQFLNASTKLGWLKRTLHGTYAWVKIPTEVSAERRQIAAAARRADKPRQEDTQGKPPSTAAEAMSELLSRIDAARKSLESMEVELKTLEERRVDEIIESISPLLDSVGFQLARKALDKYIRVRDNAKS